MCTIEVLQYRNEIDFQVFAQSKSRCGSACVQLCGVLHESWGVVHDF